MDFTYAPRHHWGTSLWSFIHTITINSHPKNVSHIEELNNKHAKEALDETIKINEKVIKILKMLKDLIPCPRCLSVYVIHLEYLDKIDLSTEMVLFKWSVELHNEVNKKLNKPIFTYQNALEMWTYKDFFWREYNKEVMPEQTIVNKQSTNNSE